jgi:hypothetical protein
VEGSCEYGIEPSGSMKCWEVLELLQLMAPQEELSSVSKYVSKYSVIEGRQQAARKVEWGNWTSTNPKTERSPRKLATATQPQFQKKSLISNRRLVSRLARTH